MYKTMIDKYLDENKKIEKIIKEIFLVYPPLNMESAIFTDIAHEISEKWSIPFHDVKVIGSCHTGFSFVKPKDSNEIKLFDYESSDIDVAIINKGLFYKIYSKTSISTKRFIINTEFYKPEHQKLFKDNLLKGYIRPDTIGDKVFRMEWLRFFKDLSSEYNMKISGAIYVDETTFFYKLKEAMEIYIKKKEGKYLNGDK